jgi:mannose-1-phosphate guanylyltransferase / mannose-6-phosphate isomerase
MLQETALRVDEESLERLIVIASSEHRFAIAEQLRSIGLSSPRIILEPVGRNTAPAAAVAALAAADDDPDALVLLMPADHLIADSAAFRRAVATGAGAAADGHCVVFGTAPRSPATGYGYIESGAPLAGHEGVNAVVRFHEKPDAAAAQAYLTSGRHWWNCGIFIVAAHVLLRMNSTPMRRRLCVPRARRWTGRSGIWTSVVWSLSVLPARRRSRSIMR